MNRIQLMIFLAFLMALNPSELLAIGSDSDIDYHADNESPVKTSEARQKRNKSKARVPAITKLEINEPPTTPDTVFYPITDDARRGKMPTTLEAVDLTDWDVIPRPKVDLTDWDVIPKSKVDFVRSAALDAAFLKKEREKLPEQTNSVAHGPIIWPAPIMASVVKKLTGDN